MADTRTIKGGVADSLYVNHADIGSAEVITSSLVDDGVTADKIARFKAGTVSITIPAISLGDRTGTAQIAVSGLLTTDYIICGINTTNTALNPIIVGSECRVAGALEVAFSAGGTTTATTPATLNYLRIVA